MKKKKIGYYCADINPSRTKSIGIYVVVKNILEQIQKSKLFEIHLILTEENKKYFKEFKCKKNIIPKNSFPYFINKFFIYPSFANNLVQKEDLDIIFFPKGHIPFRKVKKTKYASFIHDMIPLWYLKRGFLKYLPISFLLTISAKRSDIIFTNSKFSKKEIQKITSKHTIAVPLGVKSIQIKNMEKKGKTVFIIGNKNPHKNLERSIGLLESYNKKFKTNYKPFIASGGLTDKEMAEAYSRASFSMFLSSMEGFGLPFIESYNYLTPVVFNNQTSLKELGKGLPGACDIENKESVLKAIDEIRAINKIQISRIKTQLLKKYNWEKCGDTISKELIRTNI